jgi:hypothetical protein
MKTYFQISLKVFTVLLTVMLVCVGCGKNGNSTSGSGILGGMSKEDMCNPAKRFTDYKPIYREYTDDWGELCYEYKGIKIFDANGEMKYSDEEAEEYYTHYAIHFFYAHIIADKITWSKKEKKKSYVDYIKEHLFDIVCNLPLDDSYPSDIRETVNKIYYDNKDKALNMILVKRGYGFLKYESDFHIYNNFYLYRDKESGSLMANWEPHLQ